MLRTLLVAALLFAAAPTAAQTPTSRCFVQWRPTQMVPGGDVKVEYHVTCDTGWRMYLASPMNGMPTQSLAWSDHAVRDLTFTVQLSEREFKWHPVKLMRVLP